MARPSPDIIDGTFDLDALCSRRRSGIVTGFRAAGRFPSAAGNLPAAGSRTGALHDEASPRSEDFFDLAAAFGAIFHGGIGDLPEPLEFMFAFPALIFVSRHFVFLSGVPVLFIGATRRCHLPMFFTVFSQRDRISPDIGASVYSTTVVPSTWALVTAES